MLNKTNPLIKTFSSIDLALFIISAIAVTSIAGTVIPQGESLQFYSERYGYKPAVILEILNLTNMYSSYWFQGLLIILCVNLVVCSWERLPRVLAITRKDNLEISTANIANNPATTVLLSTQQYSAESKSVLTSSLESLSFKSAEKSDSEYLLLHEKGAWSRFGAYIVHLSILLIIGGALVGKFIGYSAFVFIDEGTSTPTVHEDGDSHRNIPLGFEVFCQNFTTDYYPNGSPKEYRSDLIVFESGNKVLEKTISVNDPLKYKGLTFFQASYQPIGNEYKLLVTKTNSSDTSEQMNKVYFINALSEHKAEDIGLSFKILATSDDGHGHGPYQLQITDNTTTFTRMIDEDGQIKINSDGAVYTISLGQRFATGLKVVKDPGVWIVYIGCGLMLLGLYVSFFMSHIRIWIVYQPEKDGSKVMILGKTNKNKMKLDQIREKLVETLLNEEKLALRRE